MLFLHLQVALTCLCPLFSAMYASIDTEHVLVFLVSS